MTGTERVVRFHRRLTILARTLMRTPYGTPRRCVGRPTAIRRSIHRRWSRHHCHGEGTRRRWSRRHCLWCINPPLDQWPLPRGVDPFGYAPGDLLDGVHQVDKEPAAAGAVAVVSVVRPATYSNRRRWNPKNPRRQALPQGPRPERSMRQE